MSRLNLSAVLPERGSPLSICGTAVKAMAVRNLPRLKTEVVKVLGETQCGYPTSKHSLQYINCSPTLSKVRMCDQRPQQPLAGLWIP